MNDQEVSVQELLLEDACDLDLEMDEAPSLDDQEEDEDEDLFDNIRFSKSPRLACVFGG